MKTLFTLLALMVSLSAHASLKSDFDAINKDDKGPFGLNILQGPTSRTTVKSGAYPSKVLFQAAYRTDLAQQMANDYGFYLGNMFTTNYYELMGEYVFGDARSNHPLDHASLYARGVDVMPKANLMVQNWVLEKHYLEHFHQSKLARSFKLRGIGGSEFEQPFANYFFNFYLSAMNGDFQYLPAFLLAKKSPIVNSASLQKARDLATATYDSFNESLGASNPMTAAIYKIRNAVHNQLSKDVIRQIDSFDKNFPQYRAQGHTYLFEIRKILVAYYSFGPEKIAAQAAKLGFGDIKSAAERVAKNGATPAELLELSRVATDWRTNISNPAWIENDKRAVALALLADICQYLNRELSDTDDANSPAIIEAVVNVIYVEGFLIEDNWKFFAEEAKAGANGATTLADIIEIAAGSDGSTLAEAFAQAYPKWLEVEPEMQYFMDNTIKSSALATANAVAKKVK